GELPRDRGRGRSHRAAAGLPDAGNGAGDEHARLEGGRRGNIRGGRPYQGRTREDQRAGRERRVNTIGTLVVVSGPSGVGKTTVVEQLLKNAPGLARSVSATTRPRRMGEVNYKDYVFYTAEHFEK